LCVLDLFAYVSIVLYYMCTHVVLLWHGEVSVVSLRPVWMTNHPPSVLWHCWLAHQTCKVVSEMTYAVLSGTLNLTQAVTVQVLLFRCRCVCQYQSSDWL